MMSKKFTTALLAMSIVTSFIACSSSSSKTETSEGTEQSIVELSPESTSVSGNYGDMFSIVDNIYNLEKDGTAYNLSFTMQRQEDKPYINTSKVGTHTSDKKHYISKFIVEFLDKDGILLFDSNIGNNDFNKLLSAKTNDKIGVQLKIYDTKKINKATTFRVIFSLEENTKHLEKEAEDLEKVKKAAKDMEETMEAVGNAAKAIGALGGLLEN